MKGRLRQLGWFPLIWYGLFLLGPLALVVLTGFAKRGVYGGIVWEFGFDNFLRGIDPLYFKILFNSFWIAILTTALCALIAIPLTLAIATLSSAMRSFMILVLAVPFLTNLVVRICALKSITAYDGPLAEVLRLLDVTFDPFALSQNFPLVLFGMVTTYLPFMVFPLYGALDRFDFSLVEAAADLGASYLRILVKVILPVIRRALVSGALLVFIPAMGEFLIPDLLGGAKIMLTGNLISEQFLKARDWPFGSALSILLMGLLLLAVYMMQSLDRGQKQDE